jgi:hypothetical protein
VLNRFPFTLATIKAYLKQLIIGFLNYLCLYKKL